MRRKQTGKAKGPRMISEIIRLREAGMSRRAIARALMCSRNTVDRYLEVGLGAELSTPKIYHAPWSDKVDWGDVRRRTGIDGEPLSEVWEKLSVVGQCAQGVSHVSFWREYRRRYPNVPLEMHKIHPPAERCEIDYKGKDALGGLGYFDRATGTWVPCRLFGAVLCFSQLFFPKATLTERQPDLVSSISDAYEYFGGVTHTTAFDNAKAAVTRAHNYDPDLNPEFARFCEHFSTAPLAMRRSKPKDKNQIENALGVFWRWARRHLVKQRYYSLADLNRALRALADEFNNRVQRKYGVSRRQKFEGGERERLLPLPSTQWSYGEWKKPTVHPDCHVQIDYNFYSVPHQYRGKIVDARVTLPMVEIFIGLECVARHHRFHQHLRGRYATKNDHLPAAQLAVIEATPRAVIEEAISIGPKTGQLIRQIIEDAIHPLRYLRRAQGILRLKKEFSGEDLERVSDLLISLGQTNTTYNDFKQFLQNKDRLRMLAAKSASRSRPAYLRGQKSWSN